MFPRCLEEDIEPDDEAVECVDISVQVEGEGLIGECEIFFAD